MTSALGVFVLVVFGLMVAAVALLWRRRPPEAVITVGTVGGQRGLAIHPWRGHWLTKAVACLLLGLLVIWGLSQIGSNNYAATLFWAAGCSWATSAGVEPPAGPATAPSP